MHASSAIVVAIGGSAASPVIAHREVVSLLDDVTRQEPYHVAAALPLDEAPSVIRSVAEAATEGAVIALQRLMDSLATVAATGVVGGDRKLPELSRILQKHALLHAAERALYEQAIVDGATRLGVPVTTVPATGSLFSDASKALGVDVESSLAAVVKTIGPPWKKDDREAAAAALVALDALA